MLFKYCSRNYPFSGRLKKIIQDREIGTYLDRLSISAIERPHYGYCMYHGASLAKRLGMTKVSVLEFGVAGGNGLVNLEYHARNIEKILDIEIEIYGFDTGTGLPEPEDYRDLKYHWKEGFFEMDSEGLLARLTRSKLVFGNVRDTVKTFREEFNPAPVCAMYHDLDYYSSTRDALKLFNEKEDMLLPRIFCYFDDTIGSEVELYSDYVGQRLAINEFNETNKTRKIAIPYFLRAKHFEHTWAHQLWVYHHFEHGLYDRFISDDGQQLKLSS